MHILIPRPFTGVLSLRSLSWRSRLFTIMMTALKKMSFTSQVWTSHLAPSVCRVYLSKDGATDCSKAVMSTSKKKIFMQ